MGWCLCGGWDLTITWFEKVRSCFPNHILQYFSHHFLCGYCSFMVTESAKKKKKILNDLHTFSPKRQKSCICSLYFSHVERLTLLKGAGWASGRSLPSGTLYHTTHAHLVLITHDYTPGMLWAFGPVSFYMLTLRDTGEGTSHAGRALHPVFALALIINLGWLDCLQSHSESQAPVDAGKMPFGIIHLES